MNLFPEFHAIWEKKNLKNIALFFFHSNFRQLHLPSSHVWSLGEGASELAGTDCLPCLEQRESICLQGKMRCMAMVCIAYVSDHRSTDCPLLLLWPWAVWYFFQLDYLWLSTGYWRKMHVPFMDSAELDNLYLLDMAILDTSGSDET